MRLTAAQRRHLELTLARLALEAEELAVEAAAEPGAEGIADRLRQIVAAAQELGAELGLRLEAPRRPWRKRLAAWASVWWGDVLDCRPERLRGYGEVDPEAAAILAARIQALADRMLQLAERAQEPPLAGQVPPGPPGPDTV